MAINTELDARVEQERPVQPPCLKFQHPGRRHRSPDDGAMLFQAMSETAQAMGFMLLQLEASHALQARGAFVKTANPLVQLWTPGKLCKSQRSVLQ